MCSSDLANDVEVSISDESPIANEEVFITISSKIADVPFFYSWTPMRTSGSGAVSYKDDGQVAASLEFEHITTTSEVTVPLSFSTKGDTFLIVVKVFSEFNSEVVKSEQFHIIVE